MNYYVGIQEEHSKLIFGQIIHHPFLSNTKNGSRGLRLRRRLIFPVTVLGPGKSVIVSKLSLKGEVFYLMVWELPNLSLCQCNRRHRKQGALYKAKWLWSGPTCTIFHINSQSQHTPVLHHWGGILPVSRGQTIIKILITMYQNKQSHPCADHHQDSYHNVSKQTMTPLCCTIEGDFASQLRLEHHQDSYHNVSKQIICQTSSADN